MANKFETSTGEMIDQEEIRRRLSHAYRVHDDGSVHCRGCGAACQGHAHIISQVRCKNLRKADWIYQPWNWFRACHVCNSTWESYKGEECQKMYNYDTNLDILSKYDKETYQKYVTFAAPPTLLSHDI